MAQLDGTLFSNLPASAIQYILALSDASTCKEMCLNPVSPIRSGSSAIFKVLSVDSGRDVHFDAAENTITIGVLSSGAHIAKAIGEYGPSIESVCFRLKTVPQDLFQLILKFCEVGKLTSMEVYLPDEESLVRELLNKFGPHLKDLRIAADSDHEQAIEELLNGVRNCKNLTFSYLKTMFLEHYLELWSHIGKHLEQLTLILSSDEPQNWEALLQNIRTHCPNLTCASFPNQPVGLDTETYLNFLSYGPQLEKFTPFDPFMMRPLMVAFGKADLSKLAKTCPNLKLVWFPGTPDIGRFESIKDLIDSASFLFHENRNLSKISEAVASCKRLVSLEVKPLTKHMRMDGSMGALTFNNNFLHLKKLVLKGCVTWEGLSQLLTDIPSDLTRLDIEFNDKISTGKVFESIAKELPKIETVRLVEAKSVREVLTESDLGTRHTLTADPINDFTKCESMKSLELVLGVPLPTREEFRNITRLLVLRSISFQLSDGKKQMAVQRGKYIF